MVGVSAPQGQEGLEGPDRATLEAVAVPVAVAAATRQGGEEGLRGGKRAQPREDMTSRAEGERAGKRDRCVAPRADACSHFRTDTTAMVYSSLPPFPPS